MNNFYVYRYIRLDTNAPFYVGKGSGKRAVNMSAHNEYCKRIAAAHGYRVEKMVNKIPEDLAHAKEIEFIALYKRLGYCEANFTDGGEGRSGFKLTDETKKKISESQKGNKNHMYGITHSEKTKKKMSKSQKIVKNTPEVKARMSKVAKIAMNRPETKSKMSKSQKIVKNTPEVKARMSKISKKNWENPIIREKNIKNGQKGMLKAHARPFNVYIAEGKKGNYTKGKLVGIYHNKSTCAKDLNISDKNMAYALNGKRKMCKGYIFEYCKENQ